MKILNIEGTGRIGVTIDLTTKELEAISQHRAKLLDIQAKQLDKKFNRVAEETAIVLSETLNLFDKILGDYIPIADAYADLFGKVDPGAEPLPYDWKKLEPQE